MSSDAENPSMSSERSTAPYNEDKVSSPEALENLKEGHPDFKGDWRQLERLQENLDFDTDHRGSRLHKPLKEWNEWAEKTGRRLERIHLEGATLDDARLDGADLRGARLDGANLENAHLDGANLGNAHLEDAELFRAHLEGANLACAHLEGANLISAIFDGADVRGATGIKFDYTRVFHTRFDGDTKDPWSTLRHKYSGPWFFVHLLLLIAFFAPYVAKFLYLSGLSRAQDYLLERAEALDGQSEQFEQQLSQIAAEHDQDAPWLMPLATAVGERRRATTQSARDDLTERYHQTRAVWVLVGWSEAWWVFVLALVVVGYNACRGYLTLRVNALRDAEERSQITPGWTEYGPLYRVHCWAAWLLYIAISATALNLGYWVWTTMVYVPK